MSMVVLQRKYVPPAGANAVTRIGRAVVQGRRIVRVCKGMSKMPLSPEGRDLVFGKWIEWRGGVCPIPDYEKPEIRYRSGGTTEMQANHIEWRHADAWNDVLAYRVRRSTRQG